MAYSPTRRSKQRSGCVTPTTNFALGIVMSSIDQYAVMGNPISHSKSPIIHSLFAQQTAQQMSYKAMRVEPADFQQAVAAFAAQGGKGLNITVPLKEIAWQLASEHSDRAQRAGAVNTLILQPSGALYGDNTDGVGMLRDLTINHSVQLAAQRIYILGAGGAVRGVIEPLLSQTPHQLVIVNRTLAKAQRLIELFQDRGNLCALSYEQLAGHKADVLINGTSASLAGELPPIPAQLVTDTTVCYDMMYANTLTTFLQWAQQIGSSKTIDGLGMLVEQAAESFYIWRNVRPKTQTVIEQLRSTL